MNLDASGIRSVTFYYDGVGTSCDRCMTGIKNVFSVSYRDGEVQKYGSECINKIMANEPTLKTLFNKNAKRLKRYKDYQAILSGPVEKMPKGSEYYGSGLYFIADSEGKDIMFGHFFFHPVIDEEKNANGEHYVVADPVAWAAKQMTEWHTQDEAKLASEITRLETFLAKILRSVKAVAA